MKLAMNGAMNRVTRRRLLAAAALGLAPAFAPAQVRDLADAINKAGRQRMLSQRCAKAWLALGLRVSTPQAEKVLADSMALFDRQLVELRSFAPQPEIVATYQRLDAVWSDYKVLLVGRAPARDAAGPLLEQAGRVLQLAH
jgi:nitrate/nitrite-specific signal transduction histidine kinase